MVTRRKNKNSEKEKIVSKTANVLGDIEAGKKAQDENKVEDYINFLRALASPERLDILKALEAHEMCTSDVEKKFIMEQSTASHHLTTLLRANIVTCKKSGRRVFYHINEPFLKTNYLKFVKALENIPKSNDTINYKTR